MLPLPLPLATFKDFLEPYVPWLYSDPQVLGIPLWTIIGITAGFTFTMRFVVQWFVSEKRKRIHVPEAFWHLSLWGSLLNVIYALHLDKLPLILQFSFLPVLYARNLIILRRSKIVDKETMEELERNGLEK